MAKLFSRLFRTAKRRIKQGLRDQRTYNLHRASVRLLAQHDHEQVSVAQLAREAGMSVGAFYQRFPNKDAFLRRLVVEWMDEAQRDVARKLDPAQWQRRSAGAVTQAIVETMMRNLHGPGAGVVRAALKQGHHDRDKLGPLVSFRTALADNAVALLAPRIKGIPRLERAVRATVQIAMATSLDALLHETDILRPGHQRMAYVLSTMMLRILDLPADARPQKGHDERDDLAEQAADDEEDAMLEMPVTDVVAIPIPDEPERSPQRRRHAAAKTESIPVINPSKYLPPKDTVKEPEPLPLKRRHRPRY